MTRFKIQLRELYENLGDDRYLSKILYRIFMGFGFLCALVSLFKWYYLIITAMCFLVAWAISSDDKKTEPDNRRRK